MEGYKLEFLGQNLREFFIRNRLPQNVKVVQPKDKSETINDMPIKIINPFRFTAVNFHVILQYKVWMGEAHKAKSMLTNIKNNINKQVTDSEGLM